MLHVKGHLVSIMVLYCIVLHLCWATIVFVDANAIGATPISALDRVFGDQHDLVIGLTGTALLAAVSLFMRAPWIVLLLIPQQIMLAISADGAVVAILYAQYADGVIRPRAFIAADQLHVILAAIGHGIAMLAHAQGRR